MDLALARMTEKKGHSLRKSEWRPDGAGKRHQYGRLAAILSLCLLCLAGCGEAKVPEIVESPSVAVDKGGEVSVWQIGVFDKTDYVLAELQDMAVKEAAQFNSSSGSDAAVAVEKVEALEGGKVVVAYRFDGWESCSAFLEEDLFYGTVADAVTKGIDRGAALKSVKDDSPFSQEQLLSEADKRLIITDMKANIYCPGKVTHISQGASVNEDGSIDTTGVEGTACIMLQ